MSESRTRAPAPAQAVPAERLFLAVPIPGGVRDAIRAVLPPKLPGRVVRPEHWHLTLRFLGDTDATMRDALGELLARASAREELGHCFAIRFGGLGAFPRAHRARVLWLGVVEGAQEFAALAARVERIVGVAGFAVARRAPSSHLTLSRLDPPRPLGALVEERVVVPVPLAVRAVSLFRSELTPRGPRHTRLLDAALATPSDA